MAGNDDQPYFPSVRGELAITQVRPNYQLSQCLGRHGHFQAEREELGMAKDGNCDCGEEDTAIHSV